MLIEPTYTPKQYWFTILFSGLIVGVLSIVAYFGLYWFLYVQQSFLFSIVYILPLLGSTLSLAIFKHRFVWKEFSYGSAFLMSFMIGLMSAVLLSLTLYYTYSYGLETRIDLYDSSEHLQSLMSPLAISLSMLIINVFLSLFYSLIIAIFAKRKKK